MRETLVITFILLTFGLKAQDAFVTQKFNNPLFVNPALTGNGEKVNRLSFFYRDQWRVVPVKYVSSFLNYDRKLLEKNNNKLGGGIQFLYDRAGDGALSTFNPTVSFSYTRYFNEKKQGLSTGFNVGYLIRTLDESKLQFDSQYDGTTFDPNLGSGEVFGASGKGVNLGMGINFMTKMGKLSQWDVGFALFNPHHPDFSLTDGGPQLNANKDGRPTRYTAYLTSELFVNDHWSLTPSVHFQSQEKAQEVHTSLYFSYYTRDEKTPIKWSLGGGYRIDDAALAYTGLKVKDFQMGFSYDINTSQFADATNKKGGFEVSLIYEWERKKEIVIDTLPIEVDTIYITLIDSNEINKKEDINNNKDITDIESQSDVSNEVQIEIIPGEIELIHKELPLKLFFDNDEPGSKSNDITTVSTFSSTLNQYLLRRGEYIKQVGIQEADTWFETVRNARKELDTLTYFVKSLIEKGYSIEFTLKGYTSPLADTDYNINLSMRRIASVIIELQSMNNGLLKPYFDNGSITIVQNPYGESNAPAYISDDYNNPIKSVYSKAASYERRVEIIAVEAKKK